MLGSLALLAFLGVVLCGIACMVVCVLGVLAVALEAGLEFVAETLCAWSEACGQARENAVGRLWP